MSTQPLADMSLSSDSFITKQPSCTVGREPHRDKSGHLILEAAEDQAI